MFSNIICMSALPMDENKTWTELNWIINWVITQELLYSWITSCVATSTLLLKWWKWKWLDMWPSMVTHTWNLCSAINPSKVHTYSSEHTHTVNTHKEQWAAIYAAAPGEQFGALLKGLTSVVVLKVERALYIHSPHLQFLPDLRLELTTVRLRVRLSNH